MCGATSRMMKDKLIVEEHQVDGTRLLIYIDIFTFVILVSQVRCYCNLYLLSFIVTMYCSVKDKAKYIVCQNGRSKSSLICQNPV